MPPGSMIGNIILLWPIFGNQGAWIPNKERVETEKGLAFSVYIGYNGSIREQIGLISERSDFR